MSAVSLDAASAGDDLALDQGPVLSRLPASSLQRFAFVLRPSVFAKDQLRLL
jgi:hypothetical protein